MLPIVLDVSSLKVAVIGNGLRAVRRLDMVREAGVASVSVFAPEPVEEMSERAGDTLVPQLPSADVLGSFSVIFIADLDEAEARRLAEQARGLGVLVNVEDARPLCDFHVPSVVRRGRLLLTASTGGASPALARRLREFLSQRFAPIWADRLEKIGRARQGWRDEGMSFSDVTRQTNKMIDEEGWLECQCPLKTQETQSV